MIFLALKTEDGRITGKISFYCRMLGISRQGFYKYLANKDRPWKYQDKEIRRLKEENEFLEEASAFFAASRRKSAKTRE